MSNRKTITIYTREKTLILSLAGAAVGHCDRCDFEVLLSNPESAAGLLQVTVAKISELIESEVLHAIPAPRCSAQGALLICCNSLFMAGNFTKDP